MSSPEQEKIEAIVSVLKRYSYKEEQKQNFAQAIVSGFPSRKDFADNSHPKILEWMNTLESPSLIAAKALTHFCDLYYANSDNLGVQAARILSDNIRGGSKFIDARDTFITLALTLEEKKKPGKRGTRSELVAMLIAECFVKHLGGPPTSGKGKRIVVHEKLTVKHLSAYDEVCKAVGEIFGIKISDSAREKARVKIRSRVK